MNKPYIISTFIAALMLLILKISELDLNNLRIMSIIEIVFYLIVIIGMIISYIRLKKLESNK
jgi:hypothetical protein